MTWNSYESPNLRVTASGGECRPGRLIWPKCGVLLDPNEKVGSTKLQTV